MKIVCFGDSNTYGYDPHSFFGGRYQEQCRWPDILARKLGCNVVNIGENGREIPHLEFELLQFDQMLCNQNPLDLLIIMLGSNDLLQGNCADAVAARMYAFLRHICIEPEKILLIAPPKMQLGEWVPNQGLIDVSGELACKFDSLSACCGVVFVDTGKWNIPLAFDGVHFTEAGHKKFAEQLANYLEEVAITSTQTYEVT